MEYKNKKIKMWVDSDENGYEYSSYKDGSIDVFESEEQTILTGVLDKFGNEFVRVSRFGKIGFVTFDDSK